jgi:hypothetical protein
LATRFRISLISATKEPILQPQNSNGAEQKVEQMDKVAAKFFPILYRRAEKGPNIKKNFGVLLFSLNLGKFKKYYTFQFSNKNRQRLFFSEAQMPLKQ